MVVCLLKEERLELKERGVCVCEGENLLVERGGWAGLRVLFVAIRLHGMKHHTLRWLMGSRFIRRFYLEALKDETKQVSSTVDLDKNCTESRSLSPLPLPFVSPLR